MDVLASHIALALATIAHIECYLLQCVFVLRVGEVAWEGPKSYKHHGKSLLISGNGAHELLRAQIWSHSTLAIIKAARNLGQGNGRAMLRQHSPASLCIEPR